MNYEKKILNNVIQFPGTNNPKLDEREKEVARLYIVQLIKWA